MERIRDFYDYALYKFTFTFTLHLNKVDCNRRAWQKCVIHGFTNYEYAINLYYVILALGLGLGLES